MKKTLYSPHSKIISQALVNIRKNANFTQRQLAEKLGREHSFIAHYELGERRIDLAEFYWICEACHADAAIQASNIMKVFIQFNPKASPESVHESKGRTKLSDL